MIFLDHIAVWSDNLYRTTMELNRETGIGVADGGWFPALGIGQKVISLGGGVYIEVESIVDHAMIARRDPMALMFEKQFAKGDCFSGLCFGTDSLDDLETFAAHRGIAVSPAIKGGKEPAVLAQRRTDGVKHAPDFLNSWLIGKPNIYYVPQVTDLHSSRIPPQWGTGDVVATGVLSVEVGGTEQDMRDWFGPAFDLAAFGLDFEYNGGPDGLYAVTYGSPAGPRTLRLNPITLPDAL
jgi:hypothetical protein